MAKTSEWPGKVFALLKVGNTAAAIAQIKVAPSVRDLKQLQAAIAAAKVTGRWRDVDVAIEENLALLSAPRLHRSP
ncbi:MAG: hypothetical protein A2Z93_02185 [Curvibacter sp. GWA2_64_110]|nr:MAG: hypothetical protein A2Z93_02185 [Curvibacter sp. GWA2_64_110]HCY16567.1 hypothetical protein [Curvibacter sp.]